MPPRLRNSIFSPARQYSDTLNVEARRFNRTLPAADRERLDQYLTSVREVEQRLQTAGEEQRPKPKTNRTPPRTSATASDSSTSFDSCST